MRSKGGLRSRHCRDILGTHSHFRRHLSSGPIRVPFAACCRVRGLKDFGELWKGRAQMTDWCQHAVAEWIMVQELLASYIAQGLSGTTARCSLQSKAPSRWLSAVAAAALCSVGTPLARQRLGQAKEFAYREPCEPGGG